MDRHIILLIKAQCHVIDAAAPQQKQLRAAGAAEASAAHSPQWAVSAVGCGLWAVSAAHSPQLLLQSFVYKLLLQFVNKLSCDVIDTKRH